MEQRWNPYRRALRRRDRESFDRLFEHVADQADAAGYLNSTEPEHVLLFSILVAQERELKALSDRVDELESASSLDGV